MGWRGGPFHMQLTIVCAYMDALLLRLSASVVCCYVGHQFTGALGYILMTSLFQSPVYMSIRLYSADDVVMSATSLQEH